MVVRYITFVNALPVSEMKMLGERTYRPPSRMRDVAMSMDGFIDMASFPMISISTLYLTGPPEVDVGTSTSSTLNLFLIIAVERTISRNSVSAIRHCSSRSNILTEGSITELVRAVDEEMDGIASEQRKRLETIDTELEDVKRRLGRIWNAIETSDIDIADASDRIKEHRERKERLEDAAADARAVLSQRRAHLDDVKTISAYAKDMKDFLQESELTERRAFIESFVKEIIVIPGDALIRYTIPISQSTPKTEVLLGGRFGCDWIRSGGPIGWCAT